MKKRIMLVLFALALLAALAISLYAAPAEDPAVLNQVNAAAVQMTTDNVFGDTGGTVRGVTCPYCNETATWTALTAATSRRNLNGHYYLSGDLTSNTSYYISAGKVCLHLNGHDITTTNYYAIAGAAGYEFNVMGQGNVKGAGSTTLGTVYGAGTMRLFGGTYASTGTKSYVVSVVDNANVYMYNGATINGNAGAEGTIRNASNATYYLYGGTINANGGTGLYLTKGTTYLAGVTVNAAGGRGILLPDGSTATVEQSAGTVTGAAKSNVCMYGGSYTLSGGTITGGKTTDTGGGNVFVTGTGRFHMTGGEISGGSAAEGGNVYIEKGSLTLEGGTITKGTANGAVNTKQYYYHGGGNIYVNSNASAVANISGGTVSDGTATNNSGGNILCRGNGTLNISGGTISGGKAGYPGGNIMNGASSKVTISGGVITGGKGNTAGYMPQDGDNITSFGGTLTVSGGTIESDGSRLGDGILAYYNAKIVLDGNAKITNAGKFGNIYIAKQSETATLQVNSTFTGEAGVAFHSEHGLALGASLPLDSSTGAYTGTVYAEELDCVGIVGATNNTLAVATILVNNTWYQNAEAARDAVTGNAVIKPYTAADLSLKGATYMVDLNGQNVNITGTGTVTCFDSANDDYSANGSATITGVTLANETMTEVNGKQYVKLGDNGTYTFHRLDMRVNGVSLRPSVAGIYYTCVWNCDDTLKGALDGFGVAASITGMPVDEASLEHCLYTENAMNHFESSVTKNSVIIQNILSEEAWDEEPNNSDRGKTPIFAAPYVRLKNNGNGEYLFSGGASKSLYDVMKVLDDDAYYYNNVSALESFYKTWEAAMSEWGFQNIGQALGIDPEGDGKLQLLMVGDAFSYYYLDELYGLLDETEKYPNGIEIYNLYNDGCTLSQHYNWWLNGEANYQLYRTDSTGRKEVTPSSGTRWTLEQALAVGNWDYISLQEYSGGRFIEAYENENGAFDEVCADIAASAGPLLDCFHKRFPEAQLLWHRTWAFEVGRVSGTTTYNEEMLAKYDAGMQLVSDYMCNTFDQNKPYDLKMVNSGAAWTEARALNAELETSLIPEVGGLCARWGVVNLNTYPAGEGHDNPGDGYHDGDIGGGQLLNAYVWYMTLTGDTYLGNNKYVPNYFRASGALVSLLKEAAQTVGVSAEGSDGLQIGYGRVDITPDYPVYLETDGWQNHLAETARDNIYVTCVAIRNGAEPVLLYTLDLQKVTDSIGDTAKRVISSATGVPEENILLNATHTHSSVAITRPWDGVEQYRQEFYQAVVEAAETAINDLSAASTYAGGIQTENLAFVRHYYNGAGNICGSNFGSSTSGFRSHVREADQELQLVRFEREGKKDVLLMSFPAHTTFLESGNEVSADYLGYARSYVEKNEDVLVAAFEGAAGDQNPTSRITGETDITDCQTHGETLGQYALDALSGLKKIENSEVKFSTKTFVGNTNTNGADQLAGAREVVDLVVNQGYKTSSTTVKNLYKKYGFTTYTEALWVTYRADYYNTPTQQMDLRVLTIGDELGFAIAPYEMFGVHGKQIKELSPFETTMIITCSEGAMSYLPNEESCDYGAYEYHVSLFEKGTGETLVTEFVDMLDELKGE